MLTLLDGAVVTFCILLSLGIYLRVFQTHGYQQLAKPAGPCRAYILHNQVTHARLLPRESMNAFTYPTVSLLLSLSSLESGELDLGRGWVFGYGGSPYTKILGLRPTAYLQDERQPKAHRDIRSKLCEILRERGLKDDDLHDSWIMTMPSFLGFEGINPLTVYFCYKAEGLLWLVILEVHNTFGERHVYVLETGKNEDEIRPTGYDHQWTIPRQFHVSPFNDRSGHYVVSVHSPSHSPFAEPTIKVTPPRPVVRVHLMTATSPSVLKLTALLRPVSAIPMTLHSVASTLIKAPITLFLTLPRITYQAFILHFYRRLDVYARPDPQAYAPEIEHYLVPATNPVEGGSTTGIGGGVGWQRESWIESWAKIKMEEYLVKQVAKSGTSASPFEVELIPSNPFDSRRKFSPDVEVKEKLTIYYRSAQFFTILLMMPSAQHALLLGVSAERIFKPSSDTLFLRIFTPIKSNRQSPSLTQIMRSRLVPPSVKLAIPSTHPLDQPMSIRLISIVAVFYIMQILEERIFRISKARFVPGDEPGWGKLNHIYSQNPLGSHRRE